MLMRLAAVALFIVWAMSDLIIRGGNLIDGTGARARSADVRIKGGVVTEDRSQIWPLMVRPSWMPAAATWPPDSSTPTPTWIRRCSGTGAATRCPSTG